MSIISDFYDKESATYSLKRYSGISNTYVKYFFKKRLSILLSYFKKYICNEKGVISFLEIGCGDGILIKSLKKEFPNCFSKIIGIDIAPEMIRVANKMNSDEISSFFVRGNEPQDKYDVILAVGFLSLPMFKKDFLFIDKNLKKGGYFIWSLVGKDSIYSRIKLKKEDYFKDYFTFKEYEHFLSKNFEILEKKPYGLFIPKLWMFPVLAVKLQPIFEFFFKYISPNLFHEKLYLLKKKI